MAKKRQELGDDLAPDPIKLKKKPLPVDPEKAEKVIKKVHKEKKVVNEKTEKMKHLNICLLYTSPSPRDATLSRMPSSA